jgi:hypothetical protein
VPGVWLIGEVGGAELAVEGLLTLPVERLRETYERAIPAALAA